MMVHFFLFVYFLHADHTSEKFFQAAVLFLVMSLVGHSSDLFETISNLGVMLPKSRQLELEADQIG